MSEWKVVCHSCRKYGTAHPLTVRECCSQCADATATAHRVLGHSVEIVAPKRVERVKDSLTVRRLTGGRA